MSEPTERCEECHEVFYPSELDTGLCYDCYDHVMGDHPNKIINYNNAEDPFNMQHIVKWFEGK